MLNKSVKYILQNKMGLLTFKCVLGNFKEQPQTVSQSLLKDSMSANPGFTGLFN